MSRKRKKKNMYEDSRNGVFDVHVFLKSGGISDQVNSLPPEPMVRKDCYDTDLSFIVEEVLDWYLHDRRASMANEDIYDLISFCEGYLRNLCSENVIRKYEQKLREFHRKKDITNFLWKKQWPSSRQRRNTDA